MIQSDIRVVFLLVLFSIASVQTAFAQPSQRPNVVFIYADDLGYGDLSCYGATKLQTPNIDRLANSGIRFTNGHCTSATCTPSRFALMTGEYPWRVGAAVLPGDAALIVPTNKITLPKVFKNAGYTTAIVGKWHLGIGTDVQKDWNRAISPGPNETGFDYSYIFPATADRVPTVFLENGKVIGLEPDDPIAVDYDKKIGNEPTGKENPELLKMKASPNHGHNNTIVNGIGRIGFMTGGKTARWTDEELSFTFVDKAKAFLQQNKSKPFFLYYCATEPHVPRMPATMFKGSSGLGFRGDAILQLDWTVGEIMAELKRLGLDKNTLVIFSSDNGPVLNDGYEDGAVTQLNGHTPAANLRGGKYSAFEAGTRVPFIINWPGKIQPKVSPALVSQMDFLASFSAMFKQTLPVNEAFDSENILNAFLGKSQKGRTIFVQQGGALSVVKDNWKYIEPRKGPELFVQTNIESGNSETPQLYNLANDIGEKNNLAARYPAKVKELAALLTQIRNKNKR